MAPLSNARGEAFCDYHVQQWGNKCRVVDCGGTNVAGTWACAQHQPDWKRYKEAHSRSNLSGVRRAVSRPNEHQPWQNPHRIAEVQAHDQPPPDDHEDGSTQRKHFFGPARYYCTETACYPCGLAIAWSLFNKSESPSNILRFLAFIFPTPESRTSFVCIDKGCQVFRTAIANGSFNTTWKDTRFIVDTYHYSNHKRTDELCRTWCNPTPLDGSNPNLVEEVQDNSGVLRMRRLFNTQASEQLNSWLAGYAQILKRMTAFNFRWFLHAILYFHTKRILRKQAEKAANAL